MPGKERSEQEHSHGNKHLKRKDKQMKTNQVTKHQRAIDGPGRLALQQLLEKEELTKTSMSITAKGRV
jgi:hypothetical protein